MNSLKQEAVAKGTTATAASSQEEHRYKMFSGLNFSDPTFQKFRHGTEVFVSLTADTDPLQDIRAISLHRSFYIHSGPFNSLPSISSLAASSQLLLPLDSSPAVARLPSTAMWSLSRTTKEVPFRTLPDTERFRSSDLGKICSSSSVFCCRGIRNLYTESLEAVKKKKKKEESLLFYDLLLWKNCLIQYGKRTSKENKIQ